MWQDKRPKMGVGWGGSGGGGKKGALTLYLCHTRGWRPGANVLYQRE